MRKRALAHFKYNPRTSEEKCKKISWARFQKFRRCNRVVPKEMIFEEVEGEVSRPDGVDEIVVQPPWATSVEWAEDRSATNEVMPPTLDFMDSTLVMVEKRMNTPTMSHQMSMDEML